MKNYLFKGKRKDNGEWVEGYLLVDDISGTYAIVTYVNLSGNVSDLSEINICEVIPETVSQWTGLTDKNGVKIFEGDIARYEDYIGVVRWNSDSAEFDFLYDGNIVTEFDRIWGYELEVIGNKWDTPELLEV